MDTTIAFLLLGLFCIIAIASLFYAWNQGQARVKAETELEAERRQSADKLATLQQSAQDAKTALSDQFKNLANEILEEKSRRFAEQNQQNLDTLLKPLQEKLTDFRKQVDETYQSEARERFALKQEVEKLAGLNLRMTDETRALTNALKGESKTQGDWGELVLETILENSGLRKGEEYVVQDTHTISDGSRLQPDVVIRLPESKHLVIDSKVSITAYTRYMQADDESTKTAELNSHVQSIRQHIQGLSSKNYQDLYGVGSIDFVLMFIPVEPAFLSAMRHAPDIYQEALKKNIVIVCPSTLLATVRTVAHLWRQEYQNKNAQEIARQCAMLYDKFVGFVEDLDKVGQRLEQAQVSYNDAVGKLKTGRGNLIRTAENVKKLGVKPNKSLPSKLTDVADDE
ncbi:DNA recombination protein RmuC [Polynucleobacter sp. MWH-Spelu-300-X4]|uniref:DNA recombination protein RmuC n=1 Tax=Polynucleobacter sp. MWH-Spelu-300-X4 TaxID=2689109 RepID=UPI001BFD50A2|nr:DNA recombination protein RmuC [Polynucleobacter sp. MWH-Spelu-300-X4]QWD79891.1 DNA recombination protein RmuC [Polynucleobacter sp. MWH-Spelu-300-X4]